MVCGIVVNVKTSTFFIVCELSTKETLFESSWLQFFCWEEPILRVTWASANLMVEIEAHEAHGWDGRDGQFDGADALERAGSASPEAHTGASPASRRRGQVSSWSLAEAEQGLRRLRSARDIWASRKGSNGSEAGGGMHWANQGAFFCSVVWAAENQEGLWGPQLDPKTHRLSAPLGAKCKPGEIVGISSCCCLGQCPHRKSGGDVRRSACASWASLNQTRSETA